MRTISPTVLQCAPQTAGLSPEQAAKALGFADRQHRSAVYVSWKQRFAAAPKSPLQKMAHRLKTPRGKTLYAFRKQTPEPVFGIIKSVMGHRQALRDLENVKGEWNLVTMSWNIKRMFAMQAS